MTNDDRQSLLHFVSCTNENHQSIMKNVGGVEMDMHTFVCSTYSLNKINVVNLNLIYCNRQKCGFLVQRPTVSTTISLHRRFFLGDVIW